jgi:hypothetical protein
MQQCTKSDISSTQDNRAVVPALYGHGHSGRVRVSVRGVAEAGRLPRGCLIVRWFAGTAPGATLGFVAGAGHGGPGGRAAA